MESNTGFCSLLTCCGQKTTFGKSRHQNIDTQSKNRDIGLEGFGYVSITMCGPSGIEFCIECKVCILNAVIIL